MFIFNDTATTEIYTLSLHVALPIFAIVAAALALPTIFVATEQQRGGGSPTTLSIEVAVVMFIDRKSTRLNSSHANISYAVLCLKKKKPHSALHKRPVHRPLCVSALY